MVKADSLGEEATKRLRKIVDPVGANVQEIPLGHPTSGTGLSRGAVYFLQCGLRDISSELSYRVLAKAVEGGYVHRPESWGSDFFTPGGGRYELVGIVTGVGTDKGEVVAAAPQSRRARHDAATAEELYPDLDIQGIYSRAEELRDCTSDSAAISRIVGHPVQVVHQAE